jgi:Flp pilus assembly protein TadD
MHHPLMPHHATGSPSDGSEQVSATWIVAEEIARRTLAENPHSVQARLNLAFTLEANGRNEESLLEHLEAVSRSRSSFDAILALAAAYRRRERWTLALDAYSRARDLSPDDPHALAGLGEVLMEIDSLDAARPYLERACAVLTEDPERWARLGCLRAMLGDYEAAVQALRHAASLDPNEGCIHRFLGHALCSTGNSEGGRKELELACLLSPDDAIAHSALGALLFQCDSDDDALLHLREAARLAPDDVEHWHVLALVEAHAGNATAVRHALLTIERLEPGRVGGNAELSAVAAALP